MPSRYRRTTMTEQPSSATSAAPAEFAELTGSGLAAERARRQHRVDDLRAAGVEPYPYRFDRTHSAAEVRELGSRARPRAARPTWR